MNAIDIVRQMVTNGQVSQEVAEKYFPELKERDGGKIMERLIAFLSQCKAVYGDSFKQFELNIDEALDWLEKQGEQVQNLSNDERSEKNWKEPVSGDLEEAAKHYLYSNILYDDVYVGNPTDKDCIEMFKGGAEWQKEQMMAKAVITAFNVSLPSSVYDKLKAKGCKDGDKLLIVIKED